MAGKYGTPYFQNFINSDLDPSAVRSMCPMRGDTKVLVRSAKGVSIRKISEVYSTYTSKGAKYETMTSEGWASAVPVATPVTDMFKITLSNGDEIELGKNHLQPTKDRGTVHADELNAGDWLPYEKYPYDGDNGNFLTGFAIGAWLGDGSVSDGGGITFSLDAGEKDDITESYIRELFLGLGYNVKTTHPKETLRSVRVSSGSYSVIERFCTGDNALNKGISNLVFSKSEEFRRGVLTGLMFTDGSRSKKRFYTSSSTLRDTVSYLSASLGIKHICNYVDTREGRLGTNPNYRVDLPERDSYGDFYCSDEDYNYHSIVSIEKIKPANGEKNLYCFEVDNSDHLFMLPTGMITHNCRLQLDKRELRKRGGGLFGADEFTGSIGVVTINLPNIGLQTNTEEEFKKELHRRMLLAKESLEIKREVIVEANEGGLYPYTARYLKMGWKNHFSTIGLCGMNEACLNLFGEDLTTEKGNQFGQEILGYMRETIIGFQEETGNLYNLEASPSESTAYRFAKNDVKNFGKDIAVQGEGEEIYYTNSSHLPVDSYTNIFEALRLQDPLQTLYTGGTVFHGFLGEEVDASQAKHLVKTAFTNFRLPYLSITPTFSVCPTHGYLTGEQPACDICGSETEIYSRITGYYRPMKNWNKGKTGEYKKRAGYDASSTI
ncbi:MAG: hypothetical protein GY941_22005 [Planctomycetes bacterium]|nr:hypothetical protein [Planctomycetota bacterium]